MVRRVLRFVAFCVLCGALLWGCSHFGHYLSRIGRNTPHYVGFTYLLTRPLGDACAAYYRQYGHVPEGSNPEVVRALRARDREANPLGTVYLIDAACTNLNSQGEWLDFWKRPFQTRVIETNHILFISAAEDAHFGPYTRWRHIRKEWSDDLGWGYMLTPTNIDAIPYRTDMGRYAVECGIEAHHIRGTY
jgi:hypothetical protein